MGIVIVSHDLPLTAHVADRLALVDKDRQLFRTGPTAEIMSRRTLEEVYGADGVDHVLHHAGEIAALASGEAADG